MAANSYNSDVKKDFEIFGKCMFKEFYQMFASNYDKGNQKASSKIATASKFVRDLLPVYESPFAAARDVCIRAVDEAKDDFDRRKAEQMENLAYKWIDDEEGAQMRETVCQAALVLFVSLYTNITRVTTKQNTDRKAIETLTEVAVSNFENWYIEQSDKKPFSVELITEGITTDMKRKLPSSKKQTKVYDKVTRTKYDPIKLLTKPALVVDDGINAQTYFEDLSRKHPLRYGYRFLFDHELKNKSVVLNGYKQILNPEINLVKPELEKGIWRELLNAIREEDPNLMESRLKEHMVQALRYNYRSVDVDIDYCLAPVDTFLGRYEELETLKTLFTQHQVIALVGMGGLGKTQLSRKYVQVNKADYQYKYWMDSETPEKLENSFKELANILNIKSVNINKVVNDVYKKIQAVPSILVFDNVENPADVYAYLPTRVDLPPEVIIHVLVTSRWTDWSCDNQIECYKLQPFNILESLKIFEEYFGKSCIETLQNEWKELAEMLGYLPLALKITAPAIHNRYEHNCNLGTVLDDYMKQLREGADGLLNDPLTEYGNRSIYASMLLSLKQFENKTDDKWKLAVTLINAAAYMDPDGIIKEGLFKLLDNDENTWILDEALVILTKNSLFDQVVEFGEKYYTVHRIMQASIRHNHTEDGTADMYYTVALKYALADNFTMSPPEVFRYANERVSAVVEYYKKNPSKLLYYLVKCEAITAVQGVFKTMTTNQIQSVIQQQDLLNLMVYSKNLSMVQLLYYHGADINQLDHKERETPLYLALRSEHMQIATWLLENGASPSIRGRDGCTALHAACMFANHKMICDIIQRDKTAVHATDNNGNTPLFTVDFYSKSEEEILSTIRVLLDNGADITAVNKTGNTILHSAARNACEAAVSLFLQRNKDLINIVNEDDETALHVIPYRDTVIDDQCILSTIHVLVESGVDLTKMDVWGNTVLHLAAEGARVAVVSLFLKLNKDLINIVNKDGETALHVIPYNYSYRDEHILSTIRVLNNAGVDFTKVDTRGNTVLHSSARGACVAAVSLFLQRDKDLINIVNKDGETALHVIPYNYTYRDEHILSTIRVLNNAGVDLTKVDIRGNTVLHLAAQGARDTPVALILQLNKDLIDEVNEQGETVLHVIPYSDTDINNERIHSTVRVLNNAGVDLTKVDVRGNTVLHLAAESVRATVVSLFLQRNNDLINIVNEDGKTALQVISYDHIYTDNQDIVSTIRVLNNAGADLTKVDIHGNTVLHSAAKGACAETVSLILQLNKDLIDEVNEDGRTALHDLGNCFNSEYKDLSEEEREELFARMEETARVLIMNGLSLDIRDNTGCTPLNTIQPEFKDILFQVADECNKQLSEEVSN